MAVLLIMLYLFRFHFKTMIVSAYMRSPGLMATESLQHALPGCFVPFPCHSKPHHPSSPGSWYYMWWGLGPGEIFVSCIDAFMGQRLITLLSII